MPRPTLGFLPFVAAPDVIAAAEVFVAVADVAEKCEPEPEDPDREDNCTYLLTMAAADD